MGRRSMPDALSPHAPTASALPEPGARDGALSPPPSDLKLRGFPQPHAGPAAELRARQRGVILVDAIHPRLPFSSSTSHQMPFFCPVG